MSNLNSLIKVKTKKIRVAEVSVLVKGKHLVEVLRVRNQDQE